MWALSAVTYILRRGIRVRSDTQREESNVTMDVNVGMRWLQVKVCGARQKLEVVRNGFGPEPAEGTQPRQHLAFGPVKLILDFCYPKL